MSEAQLQFEKDILDLNNEIRTAIMILDLKINEFIFEYSTNGYYCDCQHVGETLEDLNMFYDECKEKYIAMAHDFQVLLYDDKFKGNRLLILPIEGLNIFRSTFISFYETTFSKVNSI